MTETIRVIIPGVPVPKGSATAFYNKSLGRAMVVQSNAAKQKPWASMIAVMARDKWSFGPVTTPVRLDMIFVMPRPKSHLRANGTVKDAFVRRDHTSKPDVDKLARCVLDALTGVVYADDSQVVGINASKCYGAETGCVLTISARVAERVLTEARKA